MRITSDDRVFIPCPTCYGNQRVWNCPFNPSEEEGWADCPDCETGEKELNPDEETFLGFKKEIEAYLAVTSFTIKQKIDTILSLGFTVINYEGTELRRGKIES